MNFRRKNVISPLLMLGLFVVVFGISFDFARESKPRSRSVQTTWLPIFETATTTTTSVLPDPVMSISPVSTPLFVGPTLPAGKSTSGAASAPKPLVATPKTFIYYDNCKAVRDAGAAPLYRGEPGYRSALDADNDGIACETSNSTTPPRSPMATTTSSKVTTTTSDVEVESPTTTPPTTEDPRPLPTFTLPLFP